MYVGIHVLRATIRQAGFFKVSEAFTAFHFNIKTLK